MVHWITNVRSIEETQSESLWRVLMMLWVPLAIAERGLVPGPNARGLETQTRTPAVIGLGCRQKQSSTLSQDDIELDLVTNL